MKQIAILILAVLTLSGCSSQDKTMTRVLTLRKEILESEQSSYSVKITADYTDKLYTFNLDCKSDDQGNLMFSVVSPESIRGITGTVSSEGGSLTFDDEILAFEPIIDGQLSPVSAPWIIMKALRSGYINAYTEEKSHTKLTLDDSYAGETLQVELWLDSDDVPQYGEILWKGRRILSVEISNFICV